MQCWHFQRLVPDGTVTNLTAGEFQQVLHMGCFGIGLPTVLFPEFMTDVLHNFFHG